MLKGWLLYHASDAKKNISYINWFIQEAESMDIKLTLVLFGDLNSLLKKHKPNFIINRTRDAFVAELIESFKIPVFNSRQITKIFNDKYKTYKMFQQKQISMQKTYLISKKHDQLCLAFPFVAKPLDGHGGTDVALIENTSQWQIYQAKRKSDCIIQSTENIQLGKDLRVFVIGKTIIAAVLRENDQDFRANFTRGGKANLYQLNKKEIILIQKIINIFEFDYVGIDFLIDQQGQLVFNEVEDVVGSRILSLTTNINIVKLYLSHIVKKLTEQHLD